MNFDEIYDAPIWVFKNQKIDLLIYLVYLDQAIKLWVGCDKKMAKFILWGLPSPRMYLWFQPLGPGQHVYLLLLMTSFH